MTDKLTDLQAVLTDESGTMWSPTLASKVERGMKARGWAWVPVEPTAEMEHAMGFVLRGQTDIDPSAWVSGDEVRAAWAAAISAVDGGWYSKQVCRVVTPEPKRRPWWKFWRRG